MTTTHPLVRFGLEIEREDVDYDGNLNPAWGWPAPPPGWSVKGDYSLHNGAEYVFDDGAHCMWSPGSAMPALWAHAAEVQTLGSSSRRAGTHVHLSVPSIDKIDYRDIAEPILIKWRPRLWKLVNATDPERTRRHSEYCIPSRRYIANNGHIPERSEGHYDVVWRDYLGSYEIRLFPSTMPYDVVWEAVRPIAAEIAEAVVAQDPGEVT